MNHFLLTCLVITCGLYGLTDTHDVEPAQSMKILAAVLTARSNVVSGTNLIDAINMKQVELPNSIFGPSVYTMAVELILNNAVVGLLLNVLSIENNRLTIKAYRFTKSWKEAHASSNDVTTSSLATLTQTDIENPNCTITYQALQDRPTNYTTDYTRCPGATALTVNVNCTHTVWHLIEENSYYIVFARVRSNEISPGWTPGQHPC